MTEYDDDGLIIYIIETTAFIEIHAKNKDEAVEKFLIGEYDYLDISLDEHNFTLPYEEDYGHGESSKI